MIKRIVAPTVFSVLTAIVLLMLACNGTSASDRRADEFIRSVGQQAIHSLTGKELSNDQRQDLFRTILNQTFDVPLIARFALGRFWRRTSEEQRKEYVELFEDFLVQAYALRFKNYSVEVFTVGKVRQINERDALVHSELALNDGRKIVVYWRVRGKAELKIIDVIIESVSMAITHRDEFSSVINRGGGKIDGLLNVLRKKTGTEQPIN